MMMKVMQRRVQDGRRKFLLVGVLLLAVLTILGACTLRRSEPGESATRRRLVKTQVTQQLVQCPNCSGSGKVKRKGKLFGSKTCKECGGKGVKPTPVSKKKPVPKVTHVSKTMTHVPPNTKPVPKVTPVSKTMTPVPPKKKSVPKHVPQYVKARVSSASSAAATPRSSNPPRSTNPAKVIKPTPIKQRVSVTAKKATVSSVDVVRVAVKKVDSTKIPERKVNHPPIPEYNPLRPGGDELMKNFLLNMTRAYYKKFGQYHSESLRWTTLYGKWRYLDEQDYLCAQARFPFSMWVFHETWKKWLEGANDTIAKLRATGKFSAEELDYVSKMFKDRYESRVECNKHRESYFV